MTPSKVRVYFQEHQLVVGPMQGFLFLLLKRGRMTDTIEIKLGMATKKLETSEGPHGWNMRPTSKISALDPSM